MPSCRTTMDVLQAADFLRPSVRIDSGSMQNNNEELKPNKQGSYKALAINRFQKIARPLKMMETWGQARHRSSTRTRTGRRSKLNENNRDCVEKQKKHWDL